MTRLVLRRLEVIATRSVEGFFKDGCTHRAAAISYYVLFSLFPLVIFTTGIVGLFLRNPELQARLVDAIMETIPLTQDQGREGVTTALEAVADERSGAIGIIGLVALGWSASAMLGALRASLNHVFKVETPRPVVLQKLIDLGMVLAFAPFFIASIVVTSALRFARNASEDIEILQNLENTMGFTWFVASLALPIAFSFLAFFFVYWIVPAKHIRLKYIVPGALLAAILFEAVKILFSLYIENVAPYDLIFGPLGAVVAFLFWVFLSANILLLGGEVVSETPDLMAGKHDVSQPRTETRKQQILRLLRSLVLPAKKKDEEEQQAKP